MKFTFILALLLVTSSSFARGVFAVHHLQRLNTPANEDVKNEYMELSLKGREEKHTKWDGYYHVDARLYPGQENNSMVSAPEFYIRRKIGNGQLSAGRKILNWNKDEQFWGLGIINANRGFSYMDFAREGIAGLHYQGRIGVIGFHLFGSFFNIPQINPSFKIENGRISSTNEWAALPFKEVIFNGTKIPIYSELIQPDVKKIVFNESIGIKLDYRWKSGVAKVFGTYKPENTLRVVATGIYDPISEAADVKASAFTNHHLVWGGNVSQKINTNMEATMGLFVDHPDVGELSSFEFEAMKIIPTYNRKTYAHGSLNYKNNYHNISLNYLQSFEGETSLANTFAQKTMWKQAIGAKWGFSWTSKFKIISFFKYDLKTKDNLTGIKLGYSISKHFNAGLGIETVDSPQSNSFWSPFKTNDSVTSELSYHF